MNARVSPESLFSASCPAANLAGRLAAADAQYNELDARWDRDDLARREKAAVNHQVAEVLDLEDRLMGDAEYVTPTTARGATLMAVLMGRAARAALAPGDETDEDPQTSIRRFYRLQARLLEYLAAESGATVEGLGLSAFHLNFGDLRSDVADLAAEPSVIARAAARS